MRPRHLLALCLLLAACQDKQPAAPQEPAKPAEVVKEVPVSAKPAEAPPEAEPVEAAEAPSVDERGSGLKVIESGQGSAAPKVEMLSGDKPSAKVDSLDDANAIGALAGGESIGDVGGQSNFGSGGLGLRGTGSGGGGGIGLGRVGAIGSGSGKGSSGYGRIGTATVRKTSVRFSDGGPADREEGEVERKGGDEFVSHGVNPMVDASKDKLSTFAIDVDTGAYTIARRSLTGGALPSPSSVRVEEFVNYFRYDLPQPKTGVF